MPSNAAGRPRTKPAEKRRHDLMKSAERLFLKKGIDETTIEEITHAAGVSKGSFYLHFSSKADVLEALRARFVQEILDGILEEVGKKGEHDWHGKLAAWAKTCAAGYLDAARLHHLVFASAPPPTREGLTRNALIDSLTKVLAGGNQDNAWFLDEPSFTAVFLFNALHGVVNQEGIAGDDGDRRKLLRNIEEHFQRVVRQPRSHGL